MISLDAINLEADLWVAIELKLQASALIVRFEYMGHGVGFLTLFGRIIG